MLFGIFNVLVDLASTIYLKPNFSASFILWSIFGIFLSSPDNPISAAKHIPFGIGILKLLESMDEITAKSIAGSSIFIPPVILRKTSFFPRLNPAFFF